jgi:hypothetical protein
MPGALLSRCDDRDGERTPHPPRSRGEAAERLPWTRAKNASCVGHSAGAARHLVQSAQWGLDLAAMSLAPARGLAPMADAETVQLPDMAPPVDHPRIEKIAADASLATGLDDAGVAVGVNIAPHCHSTTIAGPRVEDLVPLDRHSLAGQS